MSSFPNAYSLKNIQSNSPRTMPGSISEVRSVHGRSKLNCNCAFYWTKVVNISVSTPGKFREFQKSDKVMEKSGKIGNMKMN